MLNNVIIVIQETVGEETQQQFGDKVLKIPQSLIRRICAATGTVGGAGAGGWVMNYLANLAGGPGALFVIIGGATIGTLSGSIVNGLCNDVFEDAAVENTARFGKDVVEYLKPSKFCKKFLTTSEEERNAFMRIASVVQRCGRYRPIDIIND